MDGFESLRSYLQLFIQRSELTLRFQWQSKLFASGDTLTPDGWIQEFTQLDMLVNSCRFDGIKDPT